MKPLAKGISPKNISRWSFPVRKYQDGGFCAGWHSLCFYTAYMRDTAKKILIVEENDACRESLGVLIKGLGDEVFEAATGLEGIDRLPAYVPI